MRAWHFTGDKLRDGRDIPAIGETLRHDGPLVICESGLHASVRITDALEYAPGPIIHRVKLGGDIMEQGDKVCARERTILWSVDATDTLRLFARRQAQSVLHLWDAPAIVKQYLETGDEAIRDAAWDAARAAAWAAARDAAGDAASAAAWAAAGASVWDAAWAAAGASAWDAAWDAARAKALRPARAAAWAAARDAANRDLERLILAAANRTLEDEQ